MGRVDAEHRESQIGRLLADAEELAEMGTWSQDLSTLEFVWSDGIYGILGSSPDSLVPSAEAFLERAHPDDRPRLAGLLGAVQGDPDSVAPEDLLTEFRVVRPDGSVREVRVLGRIERDAAGRPVRFIGVGQDVTAQRLTERELQAHYAVSQALREWGSFDEGVIGLLRRIGTALDFPMAALWTWDEDEQRLFARAFWTAPELEATEFEESTRSVSFKAGQGVPGRVWATGLPAVSDDIGRDLEFVRRDLAARLGLHSAVAFAATGENGPLAVLSFYGLDRGTISERLTRTLTGIGRELGRFFDRRRAELGSRSLSERELEVLQLAAGGNSGPQIAERLFVSPATVKTHFEHIYEKLGVGDRAAAVAHALRTGLIR